MADINIDKTVKVKLELDYVDASLVMEAISFQMDTLLKNPDAESVLKYICLADIGKSICDQVISKEDQDTLRQEAKRDKIILQALRKEKGE